MPFSCYIIGDDSLSIRCCKILIEKECIVLGIVSANRQVLDWASENGIQVFNDLSAFEKTTALVTPDYIFSISNRKILSGSIIKLPKIFCVNYHNALLPKYGGVHATSWAILNAEKTHGITWHVMTEDVDKGDILKQLEIPVLPDDTALSLNTKCHEKAAESFVNLVKELAGNEFVRTVQQGEPSYFPLSKKAPNYGLINWHDSAQNIYQVFRALTMAPYVNHLGTPKFIFNGKIYIPVQLKVGEIQPNGVQTGSITHIDDTSISVATAMQDIVISKIAAPNGKTLTIKEFVEQTDITVGDSILAPEEDLGKQLEQICSTNWKHELFWYWQLRGIYPVTLPYLQVGSGYSEINHNICLRIPDALKQKVGQVFGPYSNFSDILLTITLLYIHRINGYNKCTVNFSNPALRSASKYDGFFTKYVPFDIAFAQEQNIDSMLKVVKERLKLIEQYGPYESDIFLRYPDLDSSLEQLPLAINIGNRFEEVIFPNGSVFLITIYSSGKLNFSSRGIRFEKEMEVLTQRIFVHLTTMLSAITEQTRQSPVYQLPILSSEETKQLYKLANIDSSYTAPKDTPLLHQQVEKVALVNPYSSCLGSGDDVLIYDAVNTKASRLANYLIKHGASSGKTVAVSLEVSLMSIISMLAVMKTGAAYVPLDPGLPREQLAFILENVKASILITRTSLAKQFSIFQGTIVRLDQDLSRAYTEDKLSPREQQIIDAEHIAYIINTGGTTSGWPKSVPVSHKNILNSLSIRNDYYRNAVDGLKGDQINMLLLLSTSFDTSIAAIFWPLVEGGKLFLLPSKYRGNAGKAVEIIFERSITHIVCVPAFYERILQAASIEQLSSLRLVILGGDQLSEDLVATHKRLVPGASLYYEFGLTEVTIWSTAKKIYDAKSGETSSITIGHPVGDNSVVIVDHYQQVVPQGVVGKMLLAGQNLTHGYLGQYELTQARYKTITIGEKVIKVFDSGDLGCYSTEGIEFKGREDFQMKIRGVLIAPDQVERWLLQYPNVKECVVTCREGNRADKYIAAYIVPKNSGESFDCVKIITFLSEHLPDIMLPRAFAFLDRLPLTEHRKIDRKALPIPKMRQRVVRNAYVAPKTYIEKQLINIWIDILHVDQIGINDSFFELGGYSLLVSELLVRVNKFFGVAIPLHNFYEIPTITHLASLLGRTAELQQVIPSIPEFIQDAVLDPNIKPHEEIIPFNLKQVQAVLLTGATGFLGAHLLRELYFNTKAKIYCLVRADNKAEAWAKLSNAISNYRLKEGLSYDRFEIILGDLEKSNLGMRQDDFDLLATNVDIIYHNGAYVHHLYSYDFLKKTNVQSVIEILKLATTNKLKAVHYVSALSVANVDDSGKITEEVVTANVDPHNLLNGYAKTKWVAERLLIQAKSRGIPVGIYRPSWILGHSETGVCSLDKNHLLHVIKGCIQMGYAPAWEINLNIMPVDYISKIIIRASFIKDYDGCIFNLHNVHEISWIELIKWVNDQSINVQLVNPQEWRDKYLATVKSDNSLFSLLSFYQDDGSSSAKELPSIKHAILNGNTKDLLSLLEIDYPRVDLDLLRIYFNFFYEEGFIGEPANLRDLTMS